MDADIEEGGFTRRVGRIIGDEVPESITGPAPIVEELRGHLYARSSSVYGGSAQIQRSIVAERMLDLPRSR